MKKTMQYFSKRRVLFIALFAVFGFLALQVPFSNLAGSQVKFTLFDFFGPIATGFIGTASGVIAVFLMQFGNFLIHGANVLDAGTVIRFFPMLFAAFVFGKKHPVNLLIPLIAIAAFLLHPIGRTVPYYTLFWLIPIVCYFFRDRSLIARSLASTFTAHAVGGVLWIWIFNLPREVWISLIPVVAVERALFALVIAGMFILFNNILAFAVGNKPRREGFAINPRYLVLKSKDFIRNNFS
jgi:hypothetical protein